MHTLLSLDALLAGPVCPPVYTTVYCHPTAYIESELLACPVLSEVRLEPSACARAVSAGCLQTLTFARAALTTSRLKW
jgi:hypothetical protein